MTTLGEWTATLRIADISYEGNFHVINDLIVPVILGQPFLQSESVTLDFGRRCAHLGRQQRTTIYWQEQAEMAPTSDVELPSMDKLSDQARALVCKFKDVFAKGPVQTVTKITTHKIRLKTDAIINRRCYPMSAEKQRLLYEQVEEMKRMGVLEPSSSPFSSPPVLVMRPGKSPRFCVDFRALNDITIDEASTLPRIPDTIKTWLTPEFSAC